MFRYWIRSLSARLWVTSVATLAFCLILLAIGVIQLFNHYPDQTLGRHEQLENAHDIARGLVFDAAGQPVSVRPVGPSAWVLEALPAEYRYRVLDEQGRVLLASADAKNDASWTTVDPAETVGKLITTTIGGKSFRVVTVRVLQGHAARYVQTAMSARLTDAVISTKIKPIPAIVRIVLIVATIVFGLTLTMTLHFLLKPLRQASRAAAGISPRNLTTRLSLHGIPSEIRPLIQAFNEALDRLERGFAVQQQFLASAAHELQTPLTLVRGQIELQHGIEDKDTLLREIDLMARQVRQLLHLAEVSELQNFDIGDVNLVAVATDVVDYFTRKAEQGQVRLVLEASAAPASIRADRGALFILLKNIVENALHVSPPYGIVLLIVDATSIRIIDEGPGIRHDHIPFLFKRYWRAPDAKHDGAGLGLAICKEIAMAHEWSLTVRSRSPGTEFGIVFSGRSDAASERAATSHQPAT